jgi:uncharacterized damage-inducible protein DinB
VEAASEVDVSRPVSNSHRNRAGVGGGHHTGGPVCVSQGNFNPVQPNNLDEVHVAFEQSVREVEKCLRDMTAEKAQGMWRLMRGEHEIFSKPRIEVLRSIMLNHWYHHRGQLSVYLRLLDVPVPVIYGPSADENPFM